jgi:predicted RNA-binding Zn-ribbon protein involved in translation (DUF1610 family)
MISRLTNEILLEVVKESRSYFQVLDKLGRKRAGGSHSHIKNRIVKAGIDTSHFTGQAWNKGRTFPDRKTCKQILILRTSGGRAKPKQLVRALLGIGRKHECEKCGQNTKWMNNTLTLDVDHKNQNWLDDRAENLRFLCPNCHSQFSRNLIKI